MAHTGSSVPGGIGSSFGYAVEASYGTYQAPDQFIYITEFGLKPERRLFESAAWRPGKMGKPSEVEALATYQPASGPLGCEIGFSKRLKLLKWAHGQCGSAQQGGTAAYLHTFQPTDKMTEAGTSLTMQGGYSEIPSGTVEPITYLGCKCAGFELSCAVNELLKATFDVDAQVVRHTDDLQAASYAEPSASQWFHFDQMVIKRAGATLTGAKGMSFRVETGLLTDRRLADGSGKKAEPIRAAEQPSAVLTVDAEWATITALDDMLTLTPQAYVVEFVGPQAAGAYYYTFRITIPAGVIVGEPPEISGPEAIEHSLSIEARNNGSDPLWKIEVISLETSA